MFTRQLLTKALASALFSLKKNEFKSENLKFLVFTGSAGKTTLKDAVAHTLRSLNIPVESNKLGYSNELGILLTALGYSEISLKNPLNWLLLLNKKPPKGTSVCVELGADFYPDIKWFLNKFKPLAVFISGTAGVSWSRNIKDVFEERRLLLEAIPQSGFIFYNSDDPTTVELVGKSKILAEATAFSIKTRSDAAVTVAKWSRNIFRQSVWKIFNEPENVVVSAQKQTVELLLDRPIFEPQLYGILAAFAFIQKLFPDRTSELKKVFAKYRFSKDRLQIFKARNGALLIEDSYKATPYCAYWFLDMADRIPVRKKVLILSEMRPLTFNADYFYSKLADKIKFAEQVYFVGPNQHFEFMRKRVQNIKRLNRKNYIGLADDILRDYSSEDLILIKGSFVYELDELRNLLI